MKPKKGDKDGNNSRDTNNGSESFGKIGSKVDLKTFLKNVRDKMTDGSAAAIYSLSAMNYVLNLPEIYSFLDNENKEIARDIWLRLKQSGMQLRNPPMLFAADEELPAGV